MGAAVPQINKDEFTAFPKELFVAVVKADALPDLYAIGLVVGRLPRLGESRRQARLLVERLVQRVRQSPQALGAGQQRAGLFR